MVTKQHNGVVHVQKVLSPVENGIEMVLDNVQQLRTVINRIRADSAQSTKPLTMKLNGTLDAAVNGGVSKFEVFFTHDYLEQNPKCKQSVPKLKMLMEELVCVSRPSCELHVGSLWGTFCKCMLHTQKLKCNTCVMLYTYAITKYVICLQKVEFLLCNQNPAYGSMHICTCLSLCNNTIIRVITVMRYNCSTAGA